MAQDSFSLHRVRLQAFDLSERTVRRSRASAARRVDRLRKRSFLIAQMAITAGLAWWVAQHVAGHSTPFFAPVASILTLGMTFGQRLRRGVEVAIGVTVGVAVGDLWRAFFGTGSWQIVAVCALAMSLASLLGGGQLMVMQSGVQAIVVTVLASDLGYGVTRWLDALIGCALALAVATIAPSSPVRKPEAVAANVLTETGRALEAAARALRTQDGAAADAVLTQARAGEESLGELDRATTEGLAVVRASPFRRRQLGHVAALADLFDPLDHASRNLRVLARRCAIAAWRGEEVPEAYVGLLDELGDICLYMAGELLQHRLPEVARDRLRRLGETSAHLELTDTISAVVILAQVRSMTADLLELTGMRYEEARELIPEMD